MKLLNSYLIIDYILQAIGMQMKIRISYTNTVLTSHKVVVIYICYSNATAVMHNMPVISIPAYLCCM